MINEKCLSFLSFKAFYLIFWKTCYTVHFFVMNCYTRRNWSCSSNVPISSWESRRLMWRLTLFISSGEEQEVSRGENVWYLSGWEREREVYLGDIAYTQI